MDPIGTLDEERIHRQRNLDFLPIRILQHKVDEILLSVRIDKAHIRPADFHRAITVVFILVNKPPSGEDVMVHFVEDYPALVCIVELDGTVAAGLVLEWVLDGAGLIGKVMFLNVVELDGHFRYLLARR